MRLPKSEHEYKALFRSFLSPKIFIVLLMMLLTPNFVLTAFFTLIIIMMFLNPYSLGSFPEVAAGFLFFFIPVGLSVLTFYTILKQKKPNFRLIILVTILSFVFAYWEMLRNLHALPEILVLAIIVGIVIFVLSLWWRELIRERTTNARFWLLLIPLADLIYIFFLGRLVNEIVFMGIGTKLLINHWFNVYYYDQGGFEILSITIYNLLITVVLYAIVKVKKK